MEKQRGAIVEQDRVMSSRRNGDCREVKKLPVLGACGVR